MRSFTNDQWVHYLLGLLFVAAHIHQDFQIRLIDRNISEETKEDWNLAGVVFLSLMSAGLLLCRNGHILKF
ncbi:MAG: hypothetical protein ACUZ8O_08700 [Candidatus Anammoxibacter sp.]